MKLTKFTWLKLCSAAGAGLLVLSVGAGLAQAGQYIRARLTPAQVDAKANALLKEMTLREKVRMMAFENILDVPGVQRLNIPTLVMSDASLGVRR
ncbi:MAG: hypothetical protein HKL96_14015, partial [Phycisphaerales bacterium]|nr:hypothetical protein [Phycisphaerales bacterium]